MPDGSKKPIALLTSRSETIDTTTTTTITVTPKETMVVDDKEKDSQGNVIKNTIKETITEKDPKTQETKTVTTVSKKEIEKTERLVD